MSFPNKAEQVGVLSPYSMNPNDIGRNWTNIAVGTSTNNVIIYCGNGIVVVGNNDGHIYRSVNYGVTWSDIANPPLTPGFYQNAGCYIGNGIVVIGDASGHVFRSTNYGITWTDLGALSAFLFISSAYFGNGIVVMVDSDGNIIRSTDYGVNWNFNALGGVSFLSISYLDNGIAIIGSGKGHIWRSTDNGANWTDLGQITVNILIPIEGLANFGNGIVIAVDFNGFIYRSTNFGLTWVTLTSTTTTSDFQPTLYLGNGIGVIGTFGGNVYRTTDYGITWTNLGVVITNAEVGVYLGNGVTIVTDNSTGNIWKNDISYKLDECMPSVSVGMSAGVGNTAGTTGLAYQQLVIAGGNNVTLSQSITSGSGTLSINVPAKTILAAGGNITLSSSGSTITISGGGGAGGTYVSLFQPVQGGDITSPGLVLDPASINFYRVSIPASISATQYDIIGSLSLASNSTGGYTFSYGVYTMIGSTANLASSTSAGSSFTSGSHTNSTGEYGGQSARRFRSAALGTWSFVPGEYLFAMGLKTANNVSMTVQGPHRISVVDIPGGGNYSKYFYDGVKTSGGSFTGLPAVVQLSEIIRTGDNLKVWWLALIGSF